MTPLLRRVALLLAATTSLLQAQVPTASGSRDPILRALLITRATNDQQQMQRGFDAESRLRVAATLRDNSGWLDSVVRERGWPGFSVVDTDGTAAAFLIAQHADSTPDAQRRFLDALRNAVAQHQAKPLELAYIEDRVRKAEGRLQLYGTQPEYDKRGDAIAPPVESPDSLDIRRAAAGLMPMAAYIKQMRAVNAQLRATQRRAAETRPAFADSTRRP